MKTFLTALLLVCFYLPVFADEAISLDDPVYGERMKELTKELRCLKCQNMTIYDSKAGLADDLRRQISDQMHAGKSDDEIVQYLVDRYGDFVRYRPRLSGETLLVWVGPFIILVIGVAALIFQIRKHRREVEDKPLSAEEEARVQSLINEQVREK